MKVVMLTTVDNPFDPFTQWDDWKAWDESKGYFTCQLLDREVRLSPNLTDAEETEAILAGIKNILKHNLSGMHKAVENEI